MLTHLKNLCMWIKNENNFIISYKFYTKVFFYYLINYLIIIKWGMYQMLLTYNYLFMFLFDRLNGAIVLN